MTETEEGINTYRIRPKIENRFRQTAVKECIRSILQEELGGKTYSSNEAGQWTKRLSTLIKDKIKELGYERYKFVVQVIIGEQRGEGVMAGSRCLWDTTTDNYASDVFLSVFIYQQIKL
ncbi:Tctex1 domain-containing protein 2 [Chamberlinius hualienensis]